MNNPFVSPAQVHLRNLEPDPKICDAKHMLEVKDVINTLVNTKVWSVLDQTNDVNIKISLQICASGWSHFAGPTSVSSAVGSKLVVALISWVTMT